MKKKFYLLGMLAAGLTFAGCTDDIDDATGNGGILSGETGYVKVSINLPTTSGNSTRVGDVNGNDNFDDGLPAEYKVNNVILALFYGKNESEAEFTEAYKLTDLTQDPTSPNDQNITTKHTYEVEEITRPSEKVYALAIVNNGGFFEVGDNKELQIKTSSNGGFTNFSGTFSNLTGNSGLISLDNLSSIANDDEGSPNFLMLNAPLSNKAAANPMTSDHVVSTLVELTVYDDEASAQLGEANSIYVERAVAKTTVKVNNSTQDDYSLTVDAEGMSYDDAKVTFLGWKLNTTNKKMYILRNVEEYPTWDKYYVNGEINRFYGTTQMELGIPLYRVYWAKDPNYNQNYTSNLAENFNVLSAEPDDWNKMANNHSETIVEAEYCAENTTTAKTMYKNQLTGVLLKARFTLANGKGDDNLFMLGSSSAIYSETDFLTRAEAAVKATDPTFRGTLGINTDVTDGTTISAVAGVKNLITGLGNDTDDKLAQAILDDADGEIKFYKGGVMYYYTSLIKHFGDVPTSVNGGVDIVDSYDEAKHLGRYGVVRNNWYELNITSVSGPGEPEILEIPEEPGDKKHSYINAEINILSWAKRQQNVDL